MTKRPVGGSLSGGRWIRVRSGNVEEWGGTDENWIKKNLVRSSSKTYIVDRIAKLIGAGIGPVRVPVPELEERLGRVSDKDWERKHMSKGKWVLKGVFTGKPSDSFDYAKTRKAIEDVLVAAEVDGKPVVKYVCDVDVTKDGEDFSVPMEVHDDFTRLKAAKRSEAVCKILKELQDKLVEKIPEEDGVIGVSYLRSFAPQE